MHSSYSVDIITNKEDCYALRTKWNQLVIKKEFPLVSFEWCMAAVDAFSETHDLRVVAIKKDSELKALAPLFKVKNIPFLRLEAIGYSFLGEPYCLLFDDKESLTHLLIAMIDTKAAIYLPKMVDDQLVNQTIAQLAKSKKCICIRRTAGNTPHIPIDEEWSSYFTKISSKRRYDLRRAEKRAAQLGGTEFKIYTPEKENLDQELSVAFKVEAKSWKGKQGTSLLHNFKLGDFYNKFAGYASESGILKLGNLYIDNHPAAMLLGIESCNKFWVLKIGYDAKYQRCSPGILLMNKTIQYAFKKRLDSFEFLGSDESWLHMWSKQHHRKHTSFGLYPLSFNGANAFIREILTMGIDRFKKKVKMRLNK